MLKGISRLIFLVVFGVFNSRIMFALNRKDRLQVAHFTNSNLQGSEPIPEITSQVKMQRVNREIRYLNFTQNCAHCFTYYLDNSNIHGLRFLTERKRTIVEKIFWILILSTSLYICVNLILQIYTKWQTSPVIVTFGAKPTYIFEVPFPAVTICPVVKSDRSIFNYTDIYLKKKNNRTVTSDEAKHFEYMSLICNPPSELVDENANLLDEEAINYITNVSPGLNEMVSLIQWNGQYLLDNFTALFQPVVTYEGLCYSFNMFNREELFTDIVKGHRNNFSNERYSDWDPDLGYSKDEDAYPRRTLNAGPKGGLTLKLFAHKKSIDYACGDSIRGFKVALHQPSDFLHLSHFFWVPLGQSVVVAIKPTRITTSEALRNYEPSIRMCIFTSEKSLKFFKYYSQLNCMFECVRNFTLKACGCVSFHMPRENSTPICGPAKRECVEKAEMYFPEIGSKLNIKKTNLLKFLNGNLTGISACGCFTSCSRLTFDAEISQADQNSKDRYLNMLEDQANPKSDDNFNEDELLYADLNIFFAETMFLGMERNELYGITDFWSNVGGIMGLFMGFSFVSIFEIVYYFTLRLCCNAKMFGRRYWAGPPEELGEVVVEENKNMY